MGTIMIKKIAVTAVLAAVSPALASDNFEIFGPGTQTCGQYLASSEHDQLLAEYWISGFFSGVSLAEPTQNQNGMHDATGEKGLTSVLKIIKAICQGEPQETLEEISGHVGPRHKEEPTMTVIASEIARRFKIGLASVYRVLEL
jgi:hypothetical protein